MNLPLIVAHRGFSSVAPENTLAAFNAAIEIGADMIELDVHLSKDNIPVVIHDHTLKRTTGIKGTVGEKTFFDLSRLDNGSWYHKKFSGERILSLYEVIEEIRGKTRLLIELKNSRTDIGLPSAVSRCIERTRTEEQVIIQSFSSSALKAFRSRNYLTEVHKLVIGNLKLFPLFHLDYMLRPGRTEQYSDFSAINHNHRYVSPKLVRKLHERGQKIYTWTVNQEHEMKKMIDCSVDGIITDKPDLLIQLLKQRSNT